MDQTNFGISPLQNAQKNSQCQWKQVWKQMSLYTRCVQGQFYVYHPMFTSLLTVFILTGTINCGQTAYLSKTDLFTILHSLTLRNTLSSIITVIFTNNVIMTCISNLTPFFFLQKNSSYHGLRTRGYHGRNDHRLLARRRVKDVATDCHHPSHHSSDEQVQFS
jgi:hypothetical protein